MLLLEDDLGLTKLYRTYLEDLGCEVKHASSLLLGEWKYFNEEYDLIVLDLKLLDGSAWPIVEDKTRDTFLIVISGNGNPTDIARVLAADRLFYKKENLPGWKILVEAAQMRRLSKETGQ